MKQNKKWLKIFNEVQLKNRLKGNDEKFIKTLLMKFYKDDQMIKLTADLYNYKKKWQIKWEIIIDYFY